MKLEYQTQKKDENKTVNQIITQQFNLSTRLLTKLIRMKKIKVNNKIVNTKNTITAYNTITIDLNTEEDNSNIIPTQMKLDILYEDDYFLVINKPAGIPVHPSRLHYTDSLCNGIKYYFDSILKLSKKIRPVNRLDLDTSGLVIFAKCEYIQEAFIQQMMLKTFKKEYLCLVTGILEKNTGRIALPISRKNGSIIERCIDIQKGKPSLTDYEVLKQFNHYSLVKCQLKTGRTHQIRVHMAAIGHPLLGDTLYGSKSNFITRQALHSYQMECLHPITKGNLIFKSPLPKDFKKLLLS